MYRRPLRRATILAITGLLAFAGTAFADQLLADGDVVTPGIQGTKALGNVPAGAEVTADVEFTLTCTGLNHVDSGQEVVLGWSGIGSAPAGGAIVSVSGVTVGPVPDAWAVDGLGCPSPVPSMIGATRSQVTLRAPTTPGTNYMYTIVYDRSLSPLGNLDGSTFSRTATQVSFSLNAVAVNTAPTLNLPASQTEEGNTTGGWIADWSGVTATDPEDDPDPTPTCSPPSGAVVPLGLTTISCSVTDSVGATTTGSFDVTVFDTTPPALSGIPGDQSVTTGDPGGAAVSYASPTATDIVDASPTVLCAPASGSTFPVGTTGVTCTALDGSGNTSTASFNVTVHFVAPHAADANWLEPVTGGQVFEANHSRTIPVKVRLYVDGVERSSGQALLTLTPCGGGDVALELPLDWSGSRWNASLDTSMLPGACYTVSASIDGLSAGAFKLELRGDPAIARTRAGTTSIVPAKVGHTKPR
jgi:HYR domain